MSTKIWLKIFSGLAAVASSMFAFLFGFPLVAGHYALVHGHKIAAERIKPDFVYGSGFRNSHRYFVVRAVSSGGGETDEANRILIDDRLCRLRFDSKAYFAKPNIIVVDAMGESAVIPECIAQTDELASWYALLALLAAIAAIAAHTMRDETYNDPEFAEWMAKRPPPL
jgi:hypothetical protein